MTDRNKRFRSQCDIDVMLDRDANTVSVDVKYKPEMFTRPMSLQRNRYGAQDIREELERQGIVIDDSKLNLIGVLDNTSKREHKHSISVTLDLCSRQAKASSASSNKKTKTSSTKKSTSANKSNKPIDQ